MSIGKLDGGTTESHKETRRQRRSGQFHKRVGAHGSLHHLRNGGDFGFLERIPENRRGGRQDTHSQYTSVQYSLFTSAERAPRAWLKADPVKNCTVIFVRLKRVLSSGVTYLIFCCSLTCRSPRAHHLPRSLFFLPQHKNTQKLSEDQKLSRLCSEASLRLDEVGQFFCFEIKKELDKMLIQSNVRCGPVPDIKVCNQYRRCSTEVQVQSLFQDQTVSGIGIVNCIDKFVREKPCGSKRKRKLRGNLVQK